jgi:hypothetical protein
MTHAFRALVALALLSPVACDAGGPDSEGGPDGPGGKADVPVSEDVLLNTTNDSHELMRGWDYLHDAAKPTDCVATPEGPQRGREVRVGERDGTFDLQFISDRQSLATELGVDLELQGSYAGVSANSKQSLLNKFSNTSTSLSYLVKIRREYTARHRQELVLSDAAQGALDQGIDKMLDVCGTNYVRGLRYGAELYVLMTYKATSERTATELKSELGVNAGAAIPGADLNASMSSRWTRAAERDDVSLEIQVAAQGFSSDGRTVDANTISAVIGGGPDQIFAAVDQLNAEMIASIDADVCRDSGSDECWTAEQKRAAGCGGEGQEACGYYYNSERQAKVNGVAASLYSGLPDWPSDMDDAYSDAIDRVQTTEDQLRTLGAMLERMSAVYLNEIEPFMEASGAVKAGYNLPVGRETNDMDAVPHDLDALVALADRWAYSLQPRSSSGGSVGVVWGNVESAFKECYQTTAVDLLRSCSDELSSSVQEGELTLIDYDETGRLLPINYIADRDALVFYDGAVEHCAETNFGTAEAPVYGRLPTKEETKHLGALVGFGVIDWSGADVRNAIWYQESETDGGCPSGESSIMVRDPAGDGIEYNCLDTNDLLANEIMALCVPQQGPLPTPQAP